MILERILVIWKIPLCVEKENGVKSSALLTIVNLAWLTRSVEWKSWLKKRQMQSVKEVNCSRGETRRARLLVKFAE